MSLEETEEFLKEIRYEGHKGNIYIYAELITAGHTGRAVQCGSNKEGREVDILQIHIQTQHMYTRTFINVLRAALDVLYGKGKGTLTLDGVHFILLLFSKQSLSGSHFCN